MEKQIKGTYMVWLYTALILSQIILIYTLATESIQIESIFSRTVLILGLFLYVVSFLYENTINKRDMICLGMIMLFGFWGIANNWSFDNYVKFAGFFLMLSVWRTGRNLIINENIENRICIAYAIQGLLLIGLYFSPYAYESYQEYVDISNELTLGFDNPNQTGIILSSTIIILLLCIKKKTIPIQLRRLILVEVATLLVLLIRTNARTAILSCGFFLFFFLFSSNKSHERKHYFLANTVLCFPALFVYCYIRLANSSFKDLEFLGKKLFSGRQRLYQSVINRWTNKPFGNLSYFNFANSHNSHLTILVNLGIIGFLLYMLYTLSEFKVFYKKGATAQQELCAVAILVLFISGCAEAAGLTGGSIYYIYFLTYIILANDSANENTLMEGLD